MQAFAGWLGDAAFFGIYLADQLRHLERLHALFSLGDFGVVHHGDEVYLDSRHLFLLGLLQVLVVAGAHPRVGREAPLPLRAGRGWGVESCGDRMLTNILWTNWQNGEYVKLLFLTQRRVDLLIAVPAHLGVVRQDLELVTSDLVRLVGV